MAMVKWGDRWTAGDAGPPILYRHHACGQITHAEPHCAACGEVFHSTDVDVEPRPGLQGNERVADDAVGLAVERKRPMWLPVTSTLRA